MLQENSMTFGVKSNQPDKIRPIDQEVRDGDNIYLGRLLREPNAHATRKATFLQHAAMPNVCVTKRVGRPKKNLIGRGLTRSWKRKRKIPEDDPAKQ